MESMTALVMEILMDVAGSGYTDAIPAGPRRYHRSGIVRVGPARKQVIGVAGRTLGTEKIRSGSGDSVRS
jgi:hypothetical protein